MSFACSAGAGLLTTRECLHRVDCCRLHSHGACVGQVLLLCRA